jgi:hypothetical protein
MHNKASLFYIYIGVYKKNYSYKMDLVEPLYSLEE